MGIQKVLLNTGKCLINRAGMMTEREMLTAYVKVHKSVSQKVPKDLFVRSIESSLKDTKTKGNISSELAGIMSSRINLSASSTRAENYVAPVKKQFGSQREALRYAKSRSIEALKCKNPHEHLVIIDPKTKSISAEYTGNSKSVSVNFWENLRIPKDSIAVHGHPTAIYRDGKAITTPVSLPDAFSIGTPKGGKAIYAFSEQGEFSYLRRKSNFQPLTASQRKHYEDLYFESMLPIYTRNFKGLGLVERLKMLLSLLTKKGRAKFSSKIFTIDEDMCRGIHRFWQKYADEMGFIYRTNYFYLK